VDEIEALQLTYTPLSDPIASLTKPSDYPALAAFDMTVDRKSKFPVLLLAIATVCWTIANRWELFCTEAIKTASHSYAGLLATKLLTAAAC
jgi:hypothetical protein